MIAIDEEVAMPTADAPAHNTPASSGYPEAWEFDGLLTSGEAVLIRPIRPADAESLCAFYANLSPESQRRRFFGAPRVLSRDDASRFTTVDDATRMAFVAIVRGELVAFANYERLDPTNSTAEIAFVVTDAYQRHGVARCSSKALLPTGA
jgi:acetyltransferase